MGQQQLLLVILVTIIVGIATVVAINTFSSAADNATLDSVRQDLTSISAAAQGYYMKPKALGGGARTFTGITFDNITFAGKIDASDKTKATNEYGSYKIETVAAQNFIVTATANVPDGTKIAVRVCPNTQVMGTAGVTAGTPGACPSP